MFATARAKLRFCVAFIAAMGAGLMLPFVAVGITANAPSTAEMEVFKSPTCMCCEAWIAHVTKNGFTAKSRDVPGRALQSLKEQVGLKIEQRSCHTAMIGGYAIEGHVPADDIKRLLEEKPDAIGLTVPGMPVGSPGMEGDTVEKYDVLLVNRDGTTKVFASH